MACPDLSLSVVNMGSRQMVVVILLHSIILLKLSLASLPFQVNSPSEVIDSNSHHEFVTNHKLALILYYNFNVEEKDLESNKIREEATTLVNLFENIGEKLNSHGIHFGVVDCETVESGRCMKKVVNSVSVYQHGTYMLEFSPTMLFDQDAILSNCLERLLMEEVPMFLSSPELRNHMKTVIEKSGHFLLMIMPGVGAKEHSQFLQLAHRHQGSLTFTHSTYQDLMKDFEMVKVSDVTAIKQGLHKGDVRLFYFNCRNSKGDSSCNIYHYLGEFDIVSLQRYIQVLESPADLTIKEANDKGLPVVVCYYPNKVLKESVEGLIGRLSEQMKGSVLFYARNSSDPEHSLNLKETNRVCSITIPGQSQKFSEYRIVRNEILKAISRSPKVTQEEDNSEIDALEKLIDEVENRDDSLDVLDDELGGRRNLSLSHLVILDRQTFDYKQHHGVVLFHIKKYDYKSRVVLRLYNKAAAALSDVKFYALDCYDWMDVCRDIGVAQYPSLRVYHQGEPLDYTGPFSVEGFKRVGLLSQFTSPLQIPSVSSLQKVKVTLEKSDFASDGMLLGLFNDEQCNEYTAYEKAAKRLVGQKLLVAAVGDLTNQLKNSHKLGTLPGIIAFYPSESDSVIKHFDKVSFTQSNIEEFAMRSSLPSFAELTPETLPVLFMSRRPQVLLFTDSTDGELFSQVKELSSDSSLRNKFSFSYLTLDGKEVNQRILESLTDKSDMPAFMVVDYSKGKVFLNSDVPGNGKVDINSMKKWLQQISIGNVAESSILEEGEWKPVHPGYDFLQMIEDDKHKAVVEHDRLNLKQTLVEKSESVEPLSVEPLTQPPTPPTKQAHLHTEL